MVSRSRYTSPLHASARFVAQRGLLKPLVWRLVDVTVLGREHLEKLSRPFVLVSNHASHLDAPLIFGALPRKLARYIAANAAADYFFDVWWRKPLASLFFNAFPVDRTGLRGRRSVATDLLDAGVPLLLFPEGGRSKTGEMGNFKPGAAALCVSRDVPALPVAIVGAAEAMPYGRSWPHKGRRPVFVTFGEPMWAEDGETAAQFSERMAKEVRGLVDYTMTYRAENG
ncbi:MAG TPA: lysophospholipid acyltransferase family protein [Propionibacteriaceae bacterium]|nr:lysophospholipid acyltransferase family protein [Propionibacteriaceae bacterium]